MANNTPANNQPALISMAQQFTGLPMSSLIGGPLMAAAQANHQMALTQIHYLMSTCFTADTKDKNSADPTYTPVMIKMKLTRGIISESEGKAEVVPITSTIELPLLTIVPLNSLAVDSVSVNFVMEVTSNYSENHSMSQKSDTHEQASFEAKMDDLLYSVDIKGSVTHDDSLSTAANTHYQKSNHATYTVNVHAGQLPLPPGVGVIIQAFSNNISPITMPNESKAK